MTSEASATHYDVIVIGAGMGGLTAASLLAKAGKKVLLVEKETRPGGFVSALVRGPYQFDTAARLIMGCAEDGPFGPGPVFKLVRDLGVKDQCEFIKVQPFVTMKFPGMSFQMWSGRQEFLEHLKSVLPKGLEELPRQFELWNRLYRGVIGLATTNGMWEMLKVGLQYPELLRYRNSTVDSALAQSIPDSRARGVVTSLIPYLALPTSRASFLLWATMMASYIDEGAYFCQGGLHTIADAVAGAFVKLGGELLLETKVNKILTMEHQAQGVVLDNGQEVIAPQVISNIDARDVFTNMIDPGAVADSYRRRLTTLEPSVHGVDISLVTDLDLPTLGFGFETLVYNKLQFEGTQQGDTFSRDVDMYTLTVTTAVDHSLVSPGRHLISAIRGIPPGIKLTPDIISEVGESLFMDISSKIPDLSSHLIRDEAGNPAQGYYVKEHLNIYGWATTPQQIGIYRLAQRTPINGLYLVGHWTRLGPGVISVVLSGMALARMLLG